MKIKSNYNKLIAFFTGIICFMGILAFLAVSGNQLPSAHAHECGTIEDPCHECEEHNYALSDVLKGSTVAGYHLEEDYQAMLAQVGIMQTMSVQSNNTCDTHSTACGPGREDGYSTNFLSTGCRNWEGWSYGNYGVTDIPFWIDMNHRKCCA